MTKRTTTEKTKMTETKAKKLTLREQVEQLKRDLTASHAVENRIIAEADLAHTRLARANHALAETHARIAELEKELQMTRPSFKNWCNPLFRPASK